MSGIFSSRNVALKKGIFVKDNRFWNWFNAIKRNTFKRETVVVKLLEEAGVPTMVRTLNNAFSTKIYGVDLKPEGGEVTVESIEITHEGIVIANE